MSKLNKTAMYELSIKDKRFAHFRLLKNIDRRKKINYHYFQKVNHALSFLWSHKEYSVLEGVLRNLSVPAWRNIAMLKIVPKSRYTKNTIRYVHSDVKYGEMIPLIEPFINPKGLTRDSAREHLFLMRRNEARQTKVEPRKSKAQEDLEYRAYEEIDFWVHNNYDRLDEYQRKIKGFEATAFRSTKNRQAYEECHFGRRLNNIEISMILQMDFSGEYKPAFGKERPGRYGSQFGTVKKFDPAAGEAEVEIGFPTEVKEYKPSFGISDEDYLDEDEPYLDEEIEDNYI
jgi:hypothetical protein